MGNYDHVPLSVLLDDGLRVRTVRFPAGTQEEREWVARWLVYRLTLYQSQVPTVGDVPVPDPTSSPGPAGSGPNWYEQLPSAARTYTQVGFAGVVAVSFVALVGVLLVMFQGLQRQVAEQAREDRVLFRESLRQMDERQGRTEQTLREAVAEMRRAVDHLDGNQRQLRADVKTLKDRDPDPWKAPQPRSAPGSSDDRE